MQRNLRFFKIVGILVCAVVIINFIYFKIILDRNSFVFIKSEIVTDNSNKFNLQFLSNKSIDELYIRLPEISNNYVPWEMEEVFEKNGFNGYVININLEKLKLNNGSNFIDKVKESDIIITKLQIDNGSVETHDIGKITFTKRSSKITKSESLKYLSKEVANVDNNGGAITKYKVLDNIYIGLYNNEQKDKILEFGNLKINDKDIKEIQFPLKLNRGDTLKLEWKSSKFTSFKNKTVAKGQGNIFNKNNIELFSNYLDLSICIMPIGIGSSVKQEYYDRYVSMGQAEQITWFFEMFNLPDNNFNISNSIFQSMKGEE